MGFRPVRRVWTRILIGLGVGAVAGLILGRWGESGGLAGMLAGAVTIALLPLAEYFNAKRQSKRGVGKTPGNAAGIPGKKGR
jgi:hypothetical protein